MSLTTGSHLGSYEVVGLLGAGGMGEVYRARDTKLGREVAVKVIRDTLAADPDRVPRFEREAKVLASLNHPHIAALFGMEQADGRHFLIMELVEGETLADRLRRGPMHVEDVLRIARQIAEALEAAHEKGVVHRDLKPANVKITPDEQVKVLDFGLAKAMENEATGAKVADSPTLSMMATQAGIILGTAAYMSPEQAKGFPADHRSDVFSFGTVLFEMLTGRQPFQGETAPDILASVLVREPELHRLPSDLNPRLPELVRRCLEKSPKRRWQAIGDLRAEIEAIAVAPRSVAALTQPVAPRRPLWRRAMPVVLSAIVVGTLAGTAAWYLKTSPSLAVTKFSFTPPESQQLTGIGRHIVAISPDGAQIVYVGTSSRLYLRSMSELEAKAIQGTENLQGVNSPVFSPDGRSVAFYAGNDSTLKQIAVTGGTAATICPADNPFGMSWGADGIVFGQGSKGIMRVSGNGGKPEVLASVQGGELAHGPQVLPGGQHLLFTLAGSAAAGDRWNTARIVVQSLKSGERRTVIDGGSDARYLPTGHLVYALGGTLFAVAFDAQRLEVTGGRAPVLEGVRRTPFLATGAANFSVSSTGSLIYVPGPASTSTGLLDIALADQKDGLEPLKLQPATYNGPRVSLDGKRIAFGTEDGKEAIVSIYDLSGTSAIRRLTFGGNNRFPIWTSNTRVAFQSDREGDQAVFWQPADGNGAAERLTTPGQGESHAPEAWSPKADTLLFSVTKGSDVSLWTWSLQDRKATPFGAVHSSSPTGGVFSPDGRWIAYTSTEGGKTTVYVQPFPGPGNKYQLPAQGSDAPHAVTWSPDGKLFYSPGNFRFEAVSIATQPFFFGKPVAVTRRFTMGGIDVRRNYDIRQDGKFVVLITPGLAESGTTVGQIQVVLNWFEELKQRMSAQK